MRCSELRLELRELVDNMFKPVIGRSAFKVSGDWMKQFAAHQVFSVEHPDSRASGPRAVLGCNLPPSLEDLKQLHKMDQLLHADYLPSTNHHRKRE
jgi:hypothetical protein